MAFIALVDNLRIESNYMNRTRMDCHIYSLAFQPSISSISGWFFHIQGEHDVPDVNTINLQIMTMLVRRATPVITGLNFQGMLRTSENNYLEAARNYTPVPNINPYRD